MSFADSDVCNELGNLKLISTDISVNNFKFIFVRLAYLNDSGKWQDPSCFESKLFIQDFDGHFDIDDLKKSESQSYLVKVMKSQKFSLTTLPSEHVSFVLVEGNYGGNKSAFFDIYGVTQESIFLLTNESYTGELEAYAINDQLNVTFKQYDYASSEATSSASTPIIKVSKRYFIHD